MHPDDRLDRLEHRVQVLEQLVRELVAEVRSDRAAAAPPPARASVPLAAPPRPSSPSHPARPSTPAGTSRPPRPSLVDRAAEAARRAELLGSEEWLGQKGLLAIGVAAIILAAGYLLKLAFDREWISPLLRCIGGVAAGAAIGGLGWRLQPRYRVYGASLIGCGAAIVYLSVWAASTLYPILPPPSGIAGLALVSLSLAAIAWAIGVQALAAVAALGALAAPALLGRASAQGDLLLLYLATMGLALGWVAARRHWRLAAFVVSVGVFGAGSAAYDGAGARPVLLVVYAAALGAAGLAVGIREGWRELRLVAFWSGWALLVAGADRLGAPATLLLPAGVLLAAPVWRHAVRAARAWPLGPGAAPGLADVLEFYVTPFFLHWVVYRQAPAFFGREVGLAPLLVALPYLAAGLARPLAEFALVGAAALAAAAWLQWPGLEATAALFALAVAWSALSRRLGRNDLRLIGLLTYGLGFAHLYGTDAMRRGPGDAAFVGPWALALWAAAALAAALALLVWRRPPGGADGPDRAREPAYAPLVRGALWSLAGLVVFFGVTNELGRWFLQRPTGQAVAEFTRGLAVTSWWLLAGAVLVGLGTARAARLVRLAGVAALGGALGFLAMVDLSTRTASDPAFVGLWALTLWLAVIVVTALAAGLARLAAESGGSEPAVRILWLVAGALVLLGVTAELNRYFALAGDGAGSPDMLAAGLSISAWWLLFAAALVVLGFRRSLTAVRRAGLAVAALAAGKVVLYDLASLDALYRIASVLILGVVFLSLAWLYHRQARPPQGGPAA